MANNQMIIKIEEDNITITETKNGVSTSKPTSLPDLQAVLTKDRNLETPLLPGLWGTIKYASSGDHEMYVLTTPPHIRNVTYDYRSDRSAGDRIHKFKIPVPSALWTMTVNWDKKTDQRRLVHTMAYAIRSSVLGERDVLYKMPFSNVGSDYCCWGGNDPRLGTSVSIRTVPDQFMNNHFNSDLGGSKFQRFRWTKNGHSIEASLTNHLFEYLHAEQLKAEEAGTNAEFKWDCLELAGKTVADAIRDEMRRISR